MSDKALERYHHSDDASTSERWAGSKGESESSTRTNLDRIPTWLAGEDPGIMVCLLIKSLVQLISLAEPPEVIVLGLATRRSIAAGPVERELSLLWGRCGEDLDRRLPAVAEMPWSEVLRRRVTLRQIEMQWIARKIPEATKQSRGRSKSSASKPQLAALMG